FLQQVADRCRAFGALCPLRALRSLGAFAPLWAFSPLSTLWAIGASLNHARLRLVPARGCITPIRRAIFSALLTTTFPGSTIPPAAPRTAGDAGRVAAAPLAHSRPP